MSISYTLVKFIAFIACECSLFSKQFQLPVADYSQVDKEHPRLFTLAGHGWSLESCGDHGIFPDFYQQLRDY